MNTKIVIVLALAAGVAWWMMGRPKTKAQLMAERAELVKRRDQLAVGGFTAQEMPERYSIAARIAQIDLELQSAK